MDNIEDIRKHAKSVLEARLVKQNGILESKYPGTSHIHTGPLKVEMNSLIRIIDKLDNPSDILNIISPTLKGREVTNSPINPSPNKGLYLDFSENKPKPPSYIKRKLRKVIKSLTLGAKEENLLLELSDLKRHDVEALKSKFDINGERQMKSKLNKILEPRNIRIVRTIDHNLMPKKFYHLELTQTDNL